MRRLLAPLLASSLAAAIVAPGGARADAAEDHAARALAGSGAGACLVRLDVDAVVGQRPVEIAGVPFVLVTMRAAPADPRPGPNNRSAGACTPGGPPPPPEDLLVVFPTPDVAVPPDPPASVEILAETVPGFAPYGIEGGIVLTYVRALPRAR